MNFKKYGIQRHFVKLINYWIDKLPIRLCFGLLPAKIDLEALDVKHRLRSREEHTSDLV